MFEVRRVTDYYTKHYAKSQRRNGEYMVRVEYLVMSLLIIGAIMDLKYKKIHIAFTAAYFAVGIIFNILTDGHSLGSVIGGVIIGIILVLISIVTRGKVGIGDGLMVSVLGLYLGFWDNLFLLMTSLFLSAIFAVLLIIIKKEDRSYQIPFIPFLLIGFIGELILCG